PANERLTQEQPLIEEPDDEPLDQELGNQHQEDQQLAPGFTPEAASNFSKKVSSTGGKSGFERRCKGLLNVVHQWRDPQEISYTDFAALQPPIFTTTIDPLDADDWLRIIESKFSLLPALCLHGPSGSWCASFLAIKPAGHQVTWDEFCAAFRAHYLPPSLIELKQWEFRALQQGNMSVLEYMQAFIRLSQYSLEDVDTDPRRAARLLGGFDPTLLTHLGRRYDSFTELVDAAIDMEHHLRGFHEDQRRKRLASTPPLSSSQR
ncbi:hypothetical protein U9M48_002651, partial [Paspalum notatum var. saurae]